MRSFWTALVRRRRVEREMEQEWQFHLAARVEALVAGGVPRDEAERRARREFGDPLRWKEQAREARGLGLLQDLGADVRDALRRIRRAPVVTAVLVATLALTLGASLAIFSLIDRVVFRPFDVPDPSRLVVVQRIREFRGVETRRIDQWPWEAYEQVAAAATLESVAATRAVSGRLAVVFGREGQAANLAATFVTGNYLRVLGVPPAHGRDFHASDDQPGAPLVAMLGHHLWRTQLGADPRI